jgi:hypothetical protein
MPGAPKNKAEGAFFIAIDYEHTKTLVNQNFLTTTNPITGSLHRDEGLKVCKIKSTLYLSTP